MGAASETNLEKIVILQEWALEVINNVGLQDHSTLLFKQTNILKIEVIYKMNFCIISFINKGHYLRTNITHNTRRCSDLRVQFQRWVKTQRSLRYNIPNNYNFIPATVKEITIFQLFKRETKEFLISNYWRLRYAPKCIFRYLFW